VIFGAGLFVVLIIALGLRTYGLGDQDYWLDELHSLTDSAGRRSDFEAVPHGVILKTVPRFTDLTPETTWPTVWREMKVDSHPPTYFLLLLGWRWIFGDGEFAVRVLPTLFSVLSIIPVALMLRAYGLVRPGVWAATLCAVTYCHIHIGQENRPYSLGLLFICISYWSLIKLITGWADMGRGGRWLWSLLYGAAVYLAVLTHYFTALAIIPQAVFLATPEARRFLRTWTLIIAGAACVFVLTWGGQFLAQLDFIMHQDWVQENRPDHDLRTVLRVTDLPIRLLFTHVRFEMNYIFSVAGAAIVAGSLISIWFHRARRAIVFAAWYLFPVLTFAVIDTVTDKQLLSHVRYTSVAVPGLIGMLVLAVRPLNRRLRTGLIVLFALAVVLTLQLPTQTNPENARAAELIAEQLEPGDLLVFDAMDWPPFWTARIYHNVSYYLPVYLDGPNPPVLLLRDPPSEALKQDITAYERIVVVAPRPDDIPNPIPNRYELVNSTGYIDKVGFIYLFARRATERPKGT